MNTVDLDQVCQRWRKVKLKWKQMRKINSSGVTEDWEWTACGPHCVWKRPMGWESEEKRPLGGTAENVLLPVNRKSIKRSNNNEKYLFSVTLSFCSSSTNTDLWEKTLIYLKYFQMVPSRGPSRHPQVPVYWTVCVTVWNCCYCAFKPVQDVMRAFKKCSWFALETLVNHDILSAWHETTCLQNSFSLFFHTSVVPAVEQLL